MSHYACSGSKFVVMRKVLGELPVVCSECLCAGSICLWVGKFN